MGDFREEKVLSGKSYDFALRTVLLNKELKLQRENILSKQLLSSGTSIGANVAVANADFSAKISIASKESLETKYWLRLLNDS
ncbi:MAG: four helix bundle protein [Bacteroidota bacterium]|nr:four helix bundle protein [Bacteroidota bacterium]